MYTANIFNVIFTVFKCVPNSTVWFTFNCLIQSNVCRSYSKKTVNQLYNYSTVLGAAIKCKLYSGNWDTFKNCKNYIEYIFSAIEFRVLGKNTVDTVKYS